ncbi:ATPase [Micromonospora sp. DR5-3]|uniref:N-acetylglucosamine kinase n=1 Tax=unclassified Micromonospora TaxID=2617518 RepID=UPI0011D786FB|nr:MULTISPECIES: BadF/BadG/BcrA/BcrD ATPase family protein [unclassified Micromonospora]MCW3820077.1 ATPase [Micromonospora sp. DR5-3]TYC19893.1 ATPase [Micromonospora sp. MP36]
MSALPTTHIWRCPISGSQPLVLGLDVGGSSSRALITTATGVPVGYGRAGGANPVSTPPTNAAATVAEAVRAALAGADPGAVRSAVLGIAGAGAFDEPATAAAFQRAWADLGLRCPVQVVGDVMVAFAAGTRQPSGTVLIAGTGAIAAHIHERTVVRSVDGLGWLLGDEGSGFWLGRAAAQAVASALYAGGPPGPLAVLVTRQLLGTEPGTAPRECADALVRTVYDRPPTRLAQLAPLVARAADAGDPDAKAIVRSAADRLVASVTAVRERADSTPIVLAGSVLTAGQIFQEAVRRRLSRRWSAPVLVAAPGEVGAAWLAARALPTVDDDAAATLHDALRVAALTPVPAP